MINEMKILNQVTEELRLHGYPQKSIVLNYRINGCSFDIAVLDTDTSLPLMLIECKSDIKSKENIKRTFDRIIKSINDDNTIQVWLVLANSNTEPDYYNITAILDNHNLSLQDFIVTEIPYYFNLKDEIKSTQIIAQKKRKKRYINGLKVICWIVFPIIGVAIILLDIFSCFTLKTEYLFLMGGLSVAVLIPFFREIKIGEIELKNFKREKQEEQSTLPVENERN